MRTNTNAEKNVDEKTGMKTIIKSRNRIKYRRNTVIAGLCLVATVMSLTACASPLQGTSGNGSGKGSAGLQSQGESLQDGAALEKTTAQTRVDTGFVLTGPDSYDSADTPVIVDMNSDDNTVTFLNLEIGRRYTLSMDGTTKLYDKYGESVSLEQIRKGDIVDITFLKSKKHLTSMQLSDKAWSYNNIERYEINTVRDEVTIGQEIFKLSENTQYFSGGRSIDEMDLNPADVLSFQGMDTEILSVNVEKGHGYLRLANDENFIGGWIEIGQSLIQHITEDMLLTVPEGSYEVNISYNGNGGTKHVVINRNEETTLDIGDFEIAAPKYGTILFSTSPSDTRIYIDGTEVDASQPVELEYGIHQLIAKADGYQSITRYLRVGQETAGIDVVLDAVGSDDEENSAGSTAESSLDASESDTVTGYYKVYVDAPERVEVYLDGNYVGISPCSFRKSAGSHVITLRKSGYETRSYTVQIDEEKKDFSYSFAELVKTGEGESAQDKTESTEDKESSGSTTESKESNEGTAEGKESAGNTQK